MPDHLKPLRRSGAFPLLGLILVALASGQAPPGPLKIPTVPDRHPRARDLLAGS